MFQADHDPVGLAGHKLPPRRPTASGHSAGEGGDGKVFGIRRTA